MTFDMILRGGKIVDGTGAPTFTGDIGIRDGVIAEVGGRLDSVGADVIDADGAIVTPGFVDIHTHYDGQYLWDDTLDPSFSNGVTTAIAGNCGVGFAPARPAFRHQLVEMMEGVEDIPGIVLDEGLDWKWRSFPDYLDRIGQRRYTMDVTAHLTHAPLRVYVMGERALTHEAATAADIAEMARLVGEAMAAGAAGFSSGRVLEHRSSTNAIIPGTLSERAELIAIAQAMSSFDRGVFQVNPLGAAGNIWGFGLTREQRQDEHALLADIARASGRPVTYLLTQFHEDPEEWRDMVGASARAATAGLCVRPQVSARQVGMLLSLDGYHSFLYRPSYIAIQHLNRAERARAMRDPMTRRAILAEADVPADRASSARVYGLVQHLATTLDSFYALRNPVDYEPDEDRRLDRLAAVRGVPPPELLYDILAQGEGDGSVFRFLYNFASGTLDATYAMLCDPLTISGLADGGAHLQATCDGAMPTFQLAFWGRDRSRGPRLPIEMLVHRLSGDPAQLYGFADRGRIAPGLRADLNIIDFDALGLENPRMQFDLPSGGPRLLQRSKGYVATMVRGNVTRRFDADTGSRPGRLLRL